MLKHYKNANVPKIGLLELIHWWYLCSAFYGTGAYPKHLFANHICTIAHILCFGGKKMCKFTQIMCNLHISWSTRGPRRPSTQIANHIYTKKNIFMFVPLHRFLLYLSISIVPKMSRGRGFTIAEIDSLLEIIEEVLPIGPNDWDRVTERHITFYPGLGRTRESLRRKFASLYNHKKPTGDPTCPVYVRNAKHIFEQIKEAMLMEKAALVKMLRRKKKRMMLILLLLSHTSTLLEK